MRTELPFRHGTPQKTAVLLVNLGTPTAPTTSAVRVYLREFLLDPRVVEIPRLIWCLILFGIILPLRSGRSAAKYQSIWTEQGSPLMNISQKQTEMLRQGFADRRWDVRVELAMRYGQPSVASKLDQLRADGYDRILVFPMYPQYAAATTASTFDAVFAWAKPVRNVPELRLVKHYHDHPAYIHALAESVRQHWQQHGKPNFAAGEMMLMSFHGLPEQTLLRGDPYHCECHKTARLLAEELGLDKANYRVSFQSRLGKAKWLEPYTDDVLRSLGEMQVARLDVICPGFLADCLETLEEIQDEGKETFTHAGGGVFHYIACLNDSPASKAMLTELTAQHLQGWPVDMGFEESMAEQLTASRSMALAMGASDRLQQSQ